MLKKKKRTKIRKYDFEGKKNNPSSGKAFKNTKRAEAESACRLITQRRKRRASHLLQGKISQCDVG